MTHLPARRLSQASRKVWALNYLCVAFFCLGTVAAENWDGFPLPPSIHPVESVRYSYDMRGSARVLIFWVGKSGVGGGWIDHILSSETAPDSWAEGIQILFGSDPGAVPGGHNRWGYARELSYWKDSGTERGDARLQKTLFEGFMTISKEDSYKQVNSNEKNGDPNASDFEASISRVLPEVATAELRRFQSSSVVSYREPGLVGRQYLDVDIFRPPDVDRRLKNAPPSYEMPAGFLTSVHQYLKDAIRESANKHALNSLQREVRTYVHNALLYSISLTKVKKHKKVAQGPDWIIRNVLELEFDARRKGSETGHEFSIWVPAEGDLAGIPIRIIDKPRWWLKIELTLKKPNASERGPVSASQN